MGSPVDSVSMARSKPEDLAYVAFTSGSTGKPKGVMGIHASLTHYPRWIEETFGCTAHDRFSMLSGLAHDPLLRDIFTPLLLGATLCIPSSETIASPGRIAQWMRDQKITFTNLTPAMGQLLTTGADNLELNALRYAFFGGDKLRAEHISALRKLAPTVKCINLYGTTESQRALRYYVVTDSEREVLPVGKGIDGVQLLIMRGMQPAGVSELGEVYIRSHHLAKGYFHEAELTAQKFLPNPRGNAPDDRLYKTGDLGRYLPDGNVELAGRRDHQIKIRGFRIESGEIEAALKSFPEINQCLVIANDDSALTAYVVGPSSCPKISAVISANVCLNT